MQVYRCVVRLAGTVTSEVPKPAVTAAEIMILRGMHGADSVVRIARSHQDKRTHVRERRRLNELYGEDKVRALFGPDFNKLPVRLEDVDAAGDETPDEDAPAADEGDAEPAKDAA